MFGLKVTWAVPEKHIINYMAFERFLSYKRRTNTIIIQFHEYDLHFAYLLQLKKWHGDRYKKFNSMNVRLEPSVIPPTDEQLYQVFNRSPASYVRKYTFKNKFHHHLFSILLHF